MNIRQRIQVLLIIVLIFLAFASHHQESGSVAYLQWLTVLAIVVFGLIFDLSFTDDSQFIFDPDADNWRRKVEAASR